MTILRLLKRNNFHLCAIVITVTKAMKDLPAHKIIIPMITTIITKKILNNFRKVKFFF